MDTAVGVVGIILTWFLLPLSNGTRCPALDGTVSGSESCRHWRARLCPSHDQVFIIIFHGRFYNQVLSETDGGDSSLAV